MRDTRSTIWGRYESQDELPRLKGWRCEPAFVTVEFDGDLYSACFGLLTQSHRKNRIGMNEEERREYECLAGKRSHNGSVPPNVYGEIEP